jgi:heat shock protein HslJ
MKKLFFITAAMLTLLLSGCSRTQETPAEAPKTDTQTAVDIHTSQNALDWAGAYRGVLPCADCEGIETVVILKADGHFTTLTRYLGKGIEIFSEEGHFTWDSTGSIVTLGEQQYQVGENHLTHLARDGSRITGELADRHILTQIPAEGIVGRYWKLVELNGKPLPSLMRTPWLTLDAKEGRVSGFGGCNHFSGAYTLDEATLRLSFQQMISTQMACIAGEDVERALYEVLDKMDNYGLTGDQLSLHRARMAPLARFEAVYWVDR